MNLMREIDPAQSTAGYSDIADNQVDSPADPVRDRERLLCVRRFQTLHLFLIQNAAQIGPNDWFIIDYQADSNRHTPLVLLQVLCQFSDGIELYSCS